MTKTQVLVRGAMGKSPLFCRLNPESRELKTITATRNREIDALACCNVILVCSGEFEVFNSGNGGRVLISVLREGDCFGINSLYLRREDTGSVIRCRKGGVLLCMDAGAYRKHLASVPEAMEAYARFCNEKIHFLLGRIADLSVPNSKDRLLCYLRTVAAPDGTVVLPGSKEGLARKLNMSRAALFAQLARLQEDGVLSCEAGRYCLKKRICHGGMI